MQLRPGKSSLDHLLHNDGTSQHVAVLLLTTVVQYYLQMDSEWLHHMPTGAFSSSSSSYASMIDEEGKRASEYFASRSRPQSSIDIAVPDNEGEPKPDRKDVTENVGCDQSSLFVEQFEIGLNDLNSDLIRSQTDNWTLPTGTAMNSALSLNNTESTTAHVHVMPQTSTTPKAASLRPSTKSSKTTKSLNKNLENSRDRQLARILWVWYCRLVTLFVFPAMLRFMKIRGKPSQDAWREKIGSLSVIALITAFVAFFTFGFNSVVCGHRPAPRVHYKDLAPLPDSSHQETSKGYVFGGNFGRENGILRRQSGRNYVVLHGRAVDTLYLGSSDRKLIQDVGGSTQNIDISLLFQNINYNCKRHIIPSLHSTVPQDANGNVPYYFPCQLLSVDSGELVKNQSTHLLTKRQEPSDAFLPGSSIESAFSIPIVQLPEAPVLVSKTLMNEVPLLTDNLPGVASLLQSPEIISVSTPEASANEIAPVLVQPLDSLSMTEIDSPVHPSVVHNLEAMGSDRMQSVATDNSVVEQLSKSSIPSQSEAIAETVRPSVVPTSTSSTSGIGSILTTEFSTSVQDVLATYFPTQLDSSALPDWSPRESSTSIVASQNTRYSLTTNNPILSTTTSSTSSEVAQPVATGVPQQLLDMQVVLAANPSSQTFKSPQHPGPSPPPLAFLPGDLAKPSTDIPFYNPELCHLRDLDRAAVYNLSPSDIPDIYYTWQDVEEEIEMLSRNLVVYAGDVLDLDRLAHFPYQDWQFSPAFQHIINIRVSTLDMTHVIGRDRANTEAARCLVQVAKIGVIDSESVGCLMSHIVLYVSVAFIFSILAIKFLLAVYFEWFVSWRMSEPSWQSEVEIADNEEICKSQERGDFNPHSTQQLPSDHDTEKGYNSSKLDACTDHTAMNVICLVTAYSEDKAGIQTTLDSVVDAEYPNSKKLILVVCDGLVTGKGNTERTCDMVLSLMRSRSLESEIDAAEHLYFSVGTGTHRLNKAKVYSGYYQVADQGHAPFHTVDQTESFVPMLVIVKTGLGKEEREGASTKPGNRGKRDSQVLLMRFFQKLLYGEPKSSLDRELYKSMVDLKFDPISFEAVLMVDADTQIYRSSLRRMVATLCKDQRVMGLCGETKIANKRDSWVSRIQVFEYFISHHLTKAFESVFGGVTCLPGCFSMYRIQHRYYGSQQAHCRRLNRSNSGRPSQSSETMDESGPAHTCVPLLADEDIVNYYSLANTDTVHDKNLLLLGEDRYLSTLMLRRFPSRKQVFVPQAKCKTIVPNRFRVLLNQRRRWINSTIHNLLELVLVRNLCGVFCFSMQFVVAIELVGTVTLPAAFAFTIYMLIMCVYQSPPPLIPLALLIIIIGAPGILILVTAHKWMYAVWMIIYLMSLPVWNFVLPLYAFWHFDDFTWGTTRQVAI